MAARRISGANRSFGDGALASPELLERSLHQNTGSKGSFSTPQERVPRQRISEIIVGKQNGIDNKMATGSAFYSNPQPMAHEQPSHPDPSLGIGLQHNSASAASPTDTKPYYIVEVNGLNN